MKWMRWIASWFGRTTKSWGPLGIGLRATLSGGSPGGWASDHREETAHNTGFNYIAIHAIAAQVAGATVTVFADEIEQPRRRSRRKALAKQSGTFSRWKSTYGADDRETDPLPTTHPLVNLLRQPNPFESGADFRYRQAQQIRLTGTCLIWNIPSVSGLTCERYVIPTSMATPVAPTTDLPRGGWRINPVASRYTPVVDDGYVDCPSWYRILGQIVDARQVQLIRLPHAWYLDDGQSPLSAGARWVDAGDAVDVARYHQLRNGVDPSVVWNLPPDVSPDQDEMDRVQAKISAKYGGPENVGRVMVAQSGTSITPLTTAPKDMCYTEGFQDFKAAILALHQTPPVAVGLQEPGAYAAYNASMKAWRHAAIQPLCDMLAESDTIHLAPQFGTGLTIEIESDTVDDTELIELQLQNDLAARARTRNEWRAVRGMPPLPAALGDQLVGPDSASIDSDQTSLSPSRDQDPDSFSSLAANPSSTLTTEQPADAGDQSQRGGDAVQRNVEKSVRRQLIEDLFSHIVDHSELADWWPDSESKTFDPSLHPRDDRGRFTKVTSPSRIEDSEEPRSATPAEIAAARQFVLDILKGRNSFTQPEKVAQLLSILPTPELIAIHREVGFAAPPQQRDHLRSSVQARIVTAPLRPDRFLPNQGSNNVVVYLQNEAELNRRLAMRLGVQKLPTLKPEVWGQLFGARPGAVVHVFGSGFSGIEIRVDHPDYSQRRNIRDSKTINNFEMLVSPAKQGLGIATQILEEQASTAARLGFKKITLWASGEGTELQSLTQDHLSEHRQSGFYAWARLGFEGQIDEIMNDRATCGSRELQSTAKDFAKRFPRVTRVSQLMKTSEGRDWWKRFGESFDATFNLNKDSLSWRILRDYLKETAHRERSKSLVAVADPDWTGLPKPPTDTATNLNRESPDSANRLTEPTSSAGEYEMPDRFSPEQEAILDEIWDRVAHES